MLETDRLRNGLEICIWADKIDCSNRGFGKATFPQNSSTSATAVSNSPPTVQRPKRCRNYTRTVYLPPSNLLSQAPSPVVWRPRQLILSTYCARALQRRGRSVSIPPSGPPCGTSLGTKGRWAFSADAVQLSDRLCHIWAFSSQHTRPYGQQWHRSTTTCPSDPGMPPPV